MNTKIAINRLSELLAVNTGIDREQCEVFLRELFVLISERLEDDENVKVKGIGSFKVIHVDERRSVNVNSGEEMIIPSHRKVSFTPDKALAEAVNAPFAIFEAVELNDGVTESMLSEVTDTPEAVSVTDVTETKTDPEPGNIFPSPEPSVSRLEESSDEEEFSEEETREAYLALEHEKGDDDSKGNVADEPEPESVPEQIEPEKVETAAATPTRQESENLSQRVSITVEAPYEPAEVHTEEKNVGDKEVEADRHRFGRGIAIGIVGTVVTLSAIFSLWRLMSPETFCKVIGTEFKYAHKNGDVVDAEVVLPEQKSYADARKQGEAVMKAEDADPEELEADVVKDEIKPVAAPAVKDLAEATADDVPTIPSDIKSNNKSDSKSDVVAAPKKEKKQYDVITKKRFLTTMAREYYGDYNLWPYIYDENKAILGHPDRIRPGTKVVIPPASKYNIDASDKNCVARAKKRGQEIYAKYK